MTGRRGLLAAAFLAEFPQLLPVGIRMVQAEDFQPDLIADVVVAGGGAAGLSAAASAAEVLEAEVLEGSRGIGAGGVLLLEKNPAVGGDTLISGGYFNAVDPVRQVPLGIEDSPERFAAQILRAGAGRNTAAVAEVLARESASTLAWLEGLGMRFLPRVFEVYGSGWPRGHKPVLPRGTGYVKTLSGVLLAHGVRVRTRSPVTALLLDDAGRVAGVRCRMDGQERVVGARRGVVIASGGFGANRGMIARYAPQMAGLASDGQPGATGELIGAAESVGVRIVNMDAVECVPGSPPELDYPVRLDYLPAAMILINAEGRRFVNEMQGRRAIAEAVLQEAAKGACWCVASGEAVAHFDPVSRKNLYRGLHAGAAWRAASFGELAERIGVPAGALEGTVREMAVKKRLKTPPFWAVRLHLRIHTTLGGIATDEHARVLDRSGRIVPGLWAAGETTGSIHGAERIGGNGIAAACTFGRLAGRGAAENLPS